MNTLGTTRRSIHGVAVALAAIASISGCGGGGGGGGGGNGGGTTLLDGRFIDGPVAGLGYVSGTQSGETGFDGRFRYDHNGDRITFSIRAIVIGDGDATSVMTPVSLVQDEDPTVSEDDDRVINIARFLQTIDNDGIPEGGIQITRPVQEATAGLVVEFAQPTADFENDTAVQAAVAALTAVTYAGPRGLVTVEDARLHLYNTLHAGHDYVGRYRGTLDAGDLYSGTWTVTIDEAGMVTGSCAFRETPACSLLGTVNYYGSLHVTGDVATSPTAFVTISAMITNGSANGHWILWAWPADRFVDDGSATGTRDGH